MFVCDSTTAVAEWQAPLVLGGPLDVIDDKDIDRSFGGLQFQAELLLECGEDGRAGGIVGAGGSARGGKPKASAPPSFGAGVQFSEKS